MKIQSRFGGGGNRMLTMRTLFRNGNGHSRRHNAWVQCLFTGFARPFHGPSAHIQPIIGPGKHQQQAVQRSGVFNGTPLT